MRLKEVHTTFIGWSVMTKAARTEAKLPITQTQFAAEHKIDHATIVDWKKRSDYPELRTQAFRDHLTDSTPEVLEALLKRIKKYGMGYEVEIWMAFVEGWDKKTVIERPEALQFGEGDIRSLLKHLPEDKRKNFYVTLAQLIAEAEHNQSQGNVFGDTEQRVDVA